MKKSIIYISILFNLFFILITKTNAEEKFYLGEHVPDIYIYMDRVDKKVYRQFRMIYKEGTNELVYCIEPGTTLSLLSYDKVDNYDPKFIFSPDKWELFKKIAYYGYGYNNHTDIKWYAITQYIIWKEYMPDSWDMYFVDKNHNKLENMFKNEIDEIYHLVNNSKDYPDINSYYDFNYGDDYTIIDKNNLINSFSANIGVINNNVLNLNDNLKPGINNIKLTLNNYKESAYFYNESGQNILTRGDILPSSINFKVFIQAGSIKINECDEYTGKESFNGATYEVLGLDDEVLEEITCKSNEICKTNYLPVGALSIRVKDVNDGFIKPDQIYDVKTYNDDVSEINICLSQIKKEKEKAAKKEKEEILSYNDDSLKYDKEINIPYTYKSSKMIYFILITITILLFIRALYVKYSK